MLRLLSINTAYKFQSIHRINRFTINPIISNTQCRFQHSNSNNNGNNQLNSTTTATTASIPSNTNTVINNSDPNRIAVAYQDFGRHRPKVYYYLGPKQQPQQQHQQPQLTNNTDNTTRPILTAFSEHSNNIHHHHSNNEYIDVINTAFNSPYIRQLMLPAAHILYHVLPKNYPRSVTPAYTPYTKWSSIAVISNSAGGVLSMQCLLYAVGLGESLAAPAAAAIQWILKDGFGQLGGMLFASYGSVSFDSDAKRWKMLAAVSLDCSMIIEILTPLVPAAFLPLAATANIAKNISWLSTSASRASIHRSFCKEENLADITAKSGSQSIAASLIGTAAGIGLSWITGTSPYNILGIFLGLSAIHLFSTYRSLCVVPMNTLNLQRTERITIEYIESNRRLMYTADNIASVENFFRPYNSILDSHSFLTLGAVFTDIVLSFASPLTAAQFTNINPDSSNINTELINSRSALFTTNLPYILQFYSNHSFFIACKYHSTAENQFEVQLLYTNTATNQDLLSGYLMAIKVRLAIKKWRESMISIEELNNKLLIEQHNSTIRTILIDALEYIQLYSTDYIAALESANWNIQHLFIEKDKNVRVTIYPTITTAGTSSTDNSNNSNNNNIDNNDILNSSPTI